VHTSVHCSFFIQQQGLKPTRSAAHRQKSPAEQDASEWWPVSKESRHGGTGEKKPHRPLHYKMKEQCAYKCTLFFFCLTALSADENSY